MQAGVATPAPTVARSAIRSAGYFLASFAASYIGVLTFYEPAQISLIWPLSGVAAVWLTTSKPRQVVPDLALLGVAAALSVLLVIGEWTLAVVGAGLAILPTAAMLAALRRWGRWPLRDPGVPVLDSLRDLVPFGGALLVGGLVTAALRASGLGVIEPSGLGNASLTAVRFVAWTFTIGALVAVWTDRRRPAAVAAPTRRGLRALEWALTTTATGWAVWLIFVSEERLPVIYPLFLVVVWASLRTSLRVAVTLSGLIGLVAVLFTLGGAGPFADVSDPRTGAVLAQGFLVSTMLMALVLALSIRDRQRALSESERLADLAHDRADLLDAVLTNIDEGIVVVQDDDRIVMTNTASKNLMPHLSGAGAFLLPTPGSPHDLTAGDGAPFSQGNLPSRTVLEGRYDGARDIGVRRGGKLMRMLEVKASPLPSPSDSRHRRAVVTLRDVTAEREERSELEGFAGVVAHDLANPLTIIVGWSEALLQLSEDPAPLDAAELRTLARRLLGASSHMQAFINDLLAYTLSRNNDLQSTAVDLSGLTEDITALRGVTDAVHVQPGMQVQGDAALLRQLVDNLVANALKYVETGTAPQVSVTAALDREWVTVSVQDNGIGIRPDERERVFDDFFRASAVRTTYRGTGLGLAICKRVVTRHGGEIWVDHSVVAPHEGHGTQVCFTLPVRTV